jgi:two-component system, LytTR family, response regulator AlgR
VKILVVDDEPLARDRLIRLLADMDSVNNVKSAANGIECLEKLSTFQADVVLLDIRMPGENGLQVAEQINQLITPPAIIFCTAYDEYALEAFRVKAQNYLVKPVSRVALSKALENSGQVTRAHISTLNHQAEVDAISVHNGREKELVPLAEVFYFRADQKYVSMFCERGERIMDDSLKAFEERFPDSLVRVHRNTLVFRPRIERLHRDNEGGYWVTLKDVPEPISVSRRHAKDIKKLF